MQRPINSAAPVIRCMFWIPFPVSLFGITSTVLPLVGTVNLCENEGLVSSSDLRLAFACLSYGNKGALKITPSNECEQAEGHNCGKDKSTSLPPQHRR